MRGAPISVFARAMLPPLSAGAASIIAVAALAIAALAPAAVGTDTGATAPPENASKNSRTEPKRSSLFFASARVIALRIESGTFGPSGWRSSGVGGSVMCFDAHSQAVFASQGRRPVSIS